MAQKMAKYSLVITPTPCTASLAASPSRVMPDVSERDFVSSLSNNDDRFTAVKIYNWLLITVYMPPAGTPQRDILYSEILLELQALISQYPSVNCLIGGDFNIDLDSDVNISRE